MSRRKRDKTRRSAGPAPKGRESAPRRSRARSGMRSGGLQKRFVLLAAAALAIPLVAVLAFLLLSGSGSEEPSGPLRAAIVDQLSLTFPNPDFAEAATETLEEAGYAVDYYPGEEVTVQFYRRLPSHDYDLLILRVHSARLMEVDLSAPTEDAILFTAEPYSETAYREEQEAERLAMTYYSEGGGQAFFGIMSSFIDYSMEGTFDDSTVVVMGCDGLRSHATAEAFLGRGAGEVVGWDRPVSAAHTDVATERLLEHMLLGGLSTEDAVARTMEEIGPDPAFDSALLYFSSGG